MKRNHFTHRHLPTLAMCMTLIGSSLCNQTHAQWTAIGNATGISAGGSSYHGITIDTSGNIYVSYHDSTVTKGSLQKYDGTSWSYVGGSAGITDYDAAFSSLAVNKTTNRLFYAYKNGLSTTAGANGKVSVREYNTTGTQANSWTGISNGEIYFNTVKIGASGYPYLTYRDLSLSGSGMGVKRYNGSSWVDVGSALSLTFGTFGYYNPMVVTNDSVYVAAQTALATCQVYKIPAQAATGTAWEAVGTTGWSTATGSIFQKNMDMAVDSAKRLYVVYVGTSGAGNKLNVKKYENGQWTSLGADNFSAGAATFVSIAVTPSGTPYVAYSDASVSTRTTVMRFTGTQWVVVGTSGISAGVATHNKIAVDNAGNPVVTFADAGQGYKTVVMKYVPVADSIDVRTQNNVPATITTQNGTLQMQAVVFPATANQNVTWSIVPVTGAATISATGLLTAQVNGVVYAKAVSVADATKFDSLAVTIAGQVDLVKVTTLNNVPATVDSGSTLQMVATITPASASQSVTWSIISVTGTATISATGLLTAQHTGTVYAKAVSVSNTAKTDSLLINITKPVGIRTIDAKQLMTVYPSPFHNQIAVSLKDVTTKEQYSFILADLSGKVLLHEEHAGSQVTLTPGAIPAGLYFLTVSGSKGTAVIKLVKE